MTTSSAGARTRKREQSRADVERAALALFRGQGFDDVTVEQICAAAGIAPATFYRYFGTKDGVLFDYQADLLRELREAVRQVDPGPSRGAHLLAVLTRFAGFLEAQGEAMALRDEIVAANPTLLPRTLAVQRAWEAEFARGLAQQRGLAAPDPAALMDAAIGLVVLRLAFRRWRDGSAPSLRLALTASFAEARGALSEPSSTGTAPLA